MLYLFRDIFFDDSYVTIDFDVIDVVIMFIERIFLGLFELSLMGKIYLNYV